MMPAIAQNSVVLSESFVSSGVRRDSLDGACMRTPLSGFGCCHVVPPS